jgi:general secretion pathway protein G
VLGQADKAKVKAAKAQIQNFKTALSMYKLSGNRFPTTSEGLEALIHNDLGERFLEQDSVPLDPWGNPYIYTSPGVEGHDYEIVCYGADGAKGGTGVDADIVSYDLAASER